LVAEYTPTGASAVGARLQINGDTGSNYNFVRMIVDSAGTISSASNTSQTFLQPSFTSQVKSLTTVNILDYSATDKHKTLLIKSGNTNTTGSFTTFLNYQSGRWANTSAVTSVSLFTSADQFAAGSTFYLYGIEA
jgi:uncharacterized protein YfdQ (DUF2303 family)